MRPADRGETDAIVRRLRGYARVFADPVHDPAGTRVRMEGLIVEGFLDLDKRLHAGEPIPEVWDGSMNHQYRERSILRSGRGVQYRWEYTYPPGTCGPAGCAATNRPCDWISKRAAESACRRCHTIRRRVDG